METDLCPDSFLASSVFSGLPSCRTFVPIITAVTQRRVIPVSSSPKMCKFTNIGVKTSTFCF